MILTCNDCDTKFLIDATQIGEKGRRVRCGHCAAVWFVKPPAPEKVEEEKKIAEAQKENLKQAVADKAAGIKPELPSTVVSQPAPKWMKAAVFVLVIANALTFVLFNKEMIGQTSFYDLVGQYDSQGVEIDYAELHIGEGEKGKKYTIEWSITNTSDEKRQLPARRIKLLDKNLDVVAQNSDKISKVMTAGETLELKPNNIPNDKGKVKYVVLEVGNPFELSLR